MKKAVAILTLATAAAVLSTGCVPITYTRSVAVHKDANGNIKEIVEYEGITEPHSESPKIKEAWVGATPFKHLKKD